MSISNELAKAAQYLTVNTSSNVITSNATLAFTGTAQISANGGVGTAGQVFTSNGSTGSPYWASASGGLTLLATLTPTNGAASATVTGLASSKYFLIVTSGVGVTPNSPLQVALSSDNGSSFGTVKTIGGSAASPYTTTTIYSSNISGYTKMITGINSSGTVVASETVVTGIINALQFTVNQNTFTGTGSIYIYGMN